MRAVAGTVLLVLLLPVMEVEAAAAQGASRWRDGLLPGRSLVRTPVADPFAARLAAGLIATDLLSTQGPERPPFTLVDPEDSELDVEATVALGAVVPLLTVAEWDAGAAMLVLEGKVFSRFRIEYEGRDDMGQDWFISGGVEARNDRLSGRAMLTHRSSHIGDEFALTTGAQRIEFGSEALDLFGALDLSSEARLYGGASWLFRSYLDWDDRLLGLGVEDRAAVQVGADGEWSLGADGLVKAWAGADVQAAERTDWDAGVSLAAGLGVDTGDDGDAGRAIRLMLTWYDGPSTMGEFFLTPESYFGIEINAIL